MDLVKRLEEYRDRERGLMWEGTFAQYFELASKKPEVGRLSHERIYHMIMDAGIETTRTGETHYKFFSQEIFGIEKPLQQIVDYFHSAAQRLEVRKRVLLLMGPVGGGKSTIVYLIKRGLEAYTRTEAGALYAIKDCPMHEEPLHLIPHELRPDVEKEFGMYIEGDLCPHCRYMVDTHYRGRIEDVPVKRIAFSEKYRIGVGTFTPSDPKSQEQNIKTGRFSMIYADEVVVSHTNEHEYQAFVGNKKSEALQDRIILAKVPYNLRVSDEIKIYEKLLKQSALQNVHIAPYTLRVASVFAVLTRLEPSKKAGMSLMKKLRLYDGEDIEDFKQKDIKELQEEAVREGMDGISPRYVINRLSNALIKQNVTCINPIDALRALRDGLDQHTSITREERERYLNFISEARKEYDQMASKEVQRAFVYSYEESAHTLLSNYLDNVEAYCNKTRLHDPITDEEMEPNEQLMRSIEEQIGITENAKRSFREEILIRISSLARKGMTFDYTSHERLKEAIEKKLFADLRDVVKITTSARTPDKEQLRKINEVVNRLMTEHGYCHVCANEILRYTGSLLNR